jgi:hypothetical protein
MASTKTAPKKTAAKEGSLTAYCMKTKEKNVPIQDAKIDIKNGRFIAGGHDGNGNKLTTILGKDKAEAAIEAGIAEKGEGWPKAAKGK